MMTIDQARKRLPDNMKDLPDEEIQEIINFVYAVVHLTLDNYKQELSND